jgi:hypothetical protein
MTYAPLIFMTKQLSLSNIVIKMLVLHIKEDCRMLWAYLFNMKITAILLVCTFYMITATDVHPTEMPDIHFYEVAISGKIK